ncbi:MAG: hypothetical protein NWE96_11470 [Candidatus Bathyarchaeota archaeon]|nr:hypothetical protein [Candidatus Bathyarchaeota archaeon]
MENSGADLSTYVHRLSMLGGSLFETKSGLEQTQQKVNSISSLLIETTLLQDIILDLDSDIKNRKYNPLKGYTSVQIAKVSEQLETKFNKLTEPLINIKNTTQVPPKKRNFWEDFLNISLPKMKRLLG